MMIGSSSANATGGNIFERVQLQAGVPYQVIVYENQEIVLPPSSLVRVTESSLNQGLMVTFQWRERVLEDLGVTLDGGGGHSPPFSTTPFCQGSVGWCGARAAGPPPFTQPPHAV